MSFGVSKQYSKIPEFDGDDKEKPFSSHLETDGGSSSRGGKLSKRQKAVLVSLVAIALVVVVTVSIVITRKDDVFGSKSTTRHTRSDRKFTLEEVLGGKFSYDSYSTQWVTDQSYLHSDGDGLKKYNMDTGTTNDIMTRPEVDASNMARVKSLSPKQKWFLFANNTNQLYRHSFYGDYYVKSLETGNIKRIGTPDDDTSEQIRYCDWSKKANALVIVYKCNIYYIDNVGDSPLKYYQITYDGVPKKIFNGVPDWVYEEEILASTNAISFSADGKYMSYGTFNATLVPFFKFPRYGNPSNLYTTIEKIAYPKAGYPNPTIKINVIDLIAVVNAGTNNKVSPTTLNPPKDVTKAEYYYCIMKWSPKNQVFIQWMNRQQNETFCSLYKPSESDGVIMESHNTPNGWIDDDYVKIPFSEDGSYYLTMLPRVVPGKGNFRHLAKVTIGDSKGSIDFLTGGEFTVQDINCYDKKNDVIYFRSTESSARERHVYSVDVQTKERKCVTCGLMKDSDGTNCTYYYPQFSKQCSWVTLMCQGPFVPFTSMYGLKTNQRVPLTSNNQTKEALKEKDVPTNIYYTVKSDDGIYDIPVRESRPKDFDPNRKYAVLFDVYGGPNTQKVLEMFQLHFNEYLITNFDIITISLDARGSGYYGYEYLYAVYKTLGYYESLDAIAVAKYLQRQSYVDPKRIAIWGWSYGGFYSATTLAMGTNVFQTAVSVAPVTDWRYYDTVYSERYMGFPSKEDNLAGYERTAVMSRAKDFAGKNFLLIHGTADDNVHFQNSAQLVSALIKEQIKFRSQFYTDKDHGINPRNHLYIIFAEFLEEHLPLRPH